MSTAYDIYVGIPNSNSSHHHIARLKAEVFTNFGKMLNLVFGSNIAQRNQRRFACLVQ